MEEEDEKWRDKESSLENAVLEAAKDERRANEANFRMRKRSSRGWGRGGYRRRGQSSSYAGLSDVLANAQATLMTARLLRRGSTVDDKALGSRILDQSFFSPRTVEMKHVLILHTISLHMQGQFALSLAFERLVSLGFKHVTSTHTGSLDGVGSFVGHSLP